jgi:hypothetical protein
MIEAKFYAKGAATKEIKKLLGEGFEVRTNAVGTIVKGDVAKAAEYLASNPFLAFRPLGDNLIVWAK